MFVNPLVFKGFSTRHARTIKTNFSLFAHQRANQLAHCERGQTVELHGVGEDTLCRSAVQILHTGVACFALPNSLMRGQWR